MVAKLLELLDCVLQGVGIRKSLSWLKAHSIVLKFTVQHLSNQYTTSRTDTSHTA